MTEDEFWAGTKPPYPPPVLFYRLYYNDNGMPLYYSMEDLPGKYIDVDAETFGRSPSNVRVVDGKIKYLKSSTILKLKPTGVGTPCHPNNVSIVVDEAHPHIKWSLK